MYKMDPVQTRVGGYLPLILLYVPSKFHFLVALKFDKRFDWAETVCLKKYPFTNRHELPWTAWKTAESSCQLTCHEFHSAYHKLAKIHHNLSLVSCFTPIPSHRERHLSQDKCVVFSVNEPDEISHFGLLCTWLLWMKTKLSSLKIMIFLRETQITNCNKNLRLDPKVSLASRKALPLVQVRGGIIFLLPTANPPIAQQTVLKRSLVLFGGCRRKEEAAKTCSVRGSFHSSL